MIIWAVVLAALLLHPAIAAGQDRNSILADVRAGQYKEACQKLEQAIQSSPKDATLWTLNGYALAHLGKQSEALASYNQALALSPDYFPALAGAAEIEYHASDQNAVPLLQKIVAIKPGDETSHAMLAALAFERQDCKTAVNEFQESQALITSQPGSLNEYASCLLQVGRPEDAIKMFSRVTEIQPESDKARYNLAVAQVMAKRYADAVATLKPLIAKHPDDGSALDILAEAYEGLLDTPNAVASLRQAIASHPDVPQYYLDFADICLAHRSYQVGIDMLNVGLKRLPNAGPLYLARGILAVQIDDFGQSRKDFEKAEQLDPELRYGRGIQGLADLQANDLARAEQDVRSRLNNAPGDAFLWYLLGETLTRGGATPDDPHFQEAVRSAEKAVQLRPDFPIARNLLARLYLNEGRTDDAIRQSRLAYEEDTTGESAQTALYHLITALRNSGKRDEIPALARKLADLREQTRAKETAERRYGLVEVSRSSSNGH
ncbi:MAG TPA: tetratricopeptide repeat protein [Bryobacteraceae bacterium]|jgi:tetratricopeptide (TPR) repeat protein|nr:tetratricopeptide repeat protein [Bryobacteraceae bacterium]